MTDSIWEKTVRLSKDFPARLERFIRDPASRQADVFYEETWDVGDRRSLTLTVKHDIFEGVVMHLTLLDEDAYRFLGGHEQALREGGELVGDYEVHDAERRYRLRIEFA